MGEDITEGRVKRTIKSLKNGKAGGIHGVVSEMVKGGGETAVERI